jgi:tRNA threonylcarbamoyladenosine modification (KEOPS) complex Cgi121 subunit
MYVGIAEVKNLKHLGKDELVQESNVQTNTILATQFLNAQLVAGPLHLLSAAQNAYNAHTGNYALARSLDVEIIVYASLQHQIGQALEIMGVTDHQETVGIVVVGTSIEPIRNQIITFISEIGTEIEPPFNPDINAIKHILTTFNIQESELNLLNFGKSIESRRAALTRIIVSRVSVVALET